MKLIALDTSSEACSAALWLDGAVHQRFLARAQHSEHILAMIDRVLAEAGLALAALDAVAFGRGPGSFTGLRIGAGVAQGLAFGAGLPVVPVSSLAALARAAGRPRVLAAVDARMRQVYWGAYERDDQGGVHPVGAEQVMDPAVVPLPAGAGWWGAGSGWAAYGDALTTRLGAHCRGASPELLPVAADVAALAAIACAAGGALPPEQALPVYVRDDVARKAP